MTSGVAVAQEAPVSLIAAGSLKAALGAVAEAFHAETGAQVEQTYGPSGLMRAGIEAARARMSSRRPTWRIPRTLAEQGRGGPVVLFARNRLCALAQPELELSTERDPSM